MKKYLFFLLSTIIAQESFSQVNLSSGLTGYFRLDGNANDDSPTAINGTNYGAVATNGFDGTSNSAMSFASNAYMEGSYDNRGITNQMSVSFWFKTTSTATYSFLLSKYNWTLDHGFYIFIDNNGAMAMHGRDGSGNGVAPAAVGNYNDGQWHHVVGIVDVNNWDLYVDCQQIQSETTLTSSPDISVNMPLTFGRDAYNANAYYSGDLDEVRIYNRPLTQTEICSMCNELLLMTNDDIEEKPLNFLIFPNPAPDKITLSGVPFTSYEVYLFDISGRIVDVIQNQNQIMFDDLASGTYLVAVRDYESGRIVTNRFVKR